MASKGLDLLVQRHADVVQSADDERDTGDGYWVYFKPGYVADELHLIHEDTLAEVEAKIKRVRICTCDDCAKMLLRRWS